MNIVWGSEVVPGLQSVNLEVEGMLRDKKEAVFVYEARGKTRAKLSSPGYALWHM